MPWSQAGINAGNSRPLDDRVNHNEQAQCFDDDSFIQTAFGNPDLTCAALSEQGLCSTLVASGIDNRCKVAGYFFVLLRSLFR